MAGLPDDRRNTSRSREVLHFGIIFTASLAASGIAYVMLRESSTMAPLLNFNAWLAGSILNLFGAHTEVNGPIVSASAFSFRISAECTSTIFTAILASAILAWPSNAKGKATGIVTGGALLFVFNLIRIITLFYIASAFPQFLDIAHFFVWQIVLILLTISLWLLWADKIVSPSSRRGGACI